MTRKLSARLVDLEKRLEKAEGSNRQLGAHVQDLEGQVACRDRQQSEQQKLSRGLELTRSGLKTECRIEVDRIDALISEIKGRRR